MSPSTIPIFPLPTVVLFPNVFLPLHIFEPRYRQMVTEALSGDRIIGMTLLRSAGRGRAKPQPPVYSIGCSGVITHVERLADGRFNLILRGVEKFQILGEEDPLPGQLYRKAHVAGLDETRRRSGSRGAGRRAATGSNPAWPRSSSAPAPNRSCRRRCPTPTWSTRWRSIWSSSRWNARRCSSSRARWPGAGR